MKIYFDDEEDSYDSNTEEEEDEEIFNMKPKNPNKKDKKDFNPDSFDYKVARSIVKIHKKKNIDEKFSKWVEENIEHLKSLYNLSGIKTTENEFYNYIYENSGKTKW